MTKLFTLISVALVAFTFATHAQPLVANQNPRYLESQNKYMHQSDSLLVTQGTTAQQTYKAIDYLQDRRDRKRELRLARASAPRYYANDGWFNNGYNGYYNFNGYNGYNNGYNSYYPSRWNNGWNNWGRNFIGRPSIGFRTGNWWFGW